jgi:hypothetical protein
MRVRWPGRTAAALVILAAMAPAIGAETPKSGGILIYMIPADAPPSLDGHRETTFATVHSAAPIAGNLCSDVNSYDGPSLG